MSWDPRGVGASTAVKCFPSEAAEIAFLGKYASPFPVGRRQQGAYIRRWREFGKICAARNYMTAYFRTGALPPKGTVCHQKIPPFLPPAG